ncbi:hypothetical protein EV146_10431 [Mesobacillus foraminis]|jgi:hypothetical protein|uniref:Uncharacterized protein n=1 Tax=Mesobacillus foraminis TaxID=279826 RepID=A0A4R2BIX9_9BACI|nr:hypothetical protein EV146_10431 [Mesobacillus foraminis]
MIVTFMTVGLAFLTAAGLNYFAVKEEGFIDSE